MATMDSQELKNNQMDAKLHYWYEHLSDVRNFFEGVNIKKKQYNALESQEEKNIRKNYMSNVYDQYFFILFVELMIIYEKRWIMRKE